MKLISLNTWGGRVREPLIKFLKEQAGTTDIFCLQEVLSSPMEDVETSHQDRVHSLDETAAALGGFRPIFHLAWEGMDSVGPVDFDLKGGQVTFVKESLQIISSGEVPLFEGVGGTKPPAEHVYRPRNFGYVRIPRKNGSLTVINVHGFTFKGDDKMDRPERIEQSRRIGEFVEGEKGPVVLCGDFNLYPNTESITMLEGRLVNLIKKYNVRRTRSRISPWHGTPDEQVFADYVFVSPDLEIASFDVPDAEISDHLPLVLEFR